MQLGLSDADFVKWNAEELEYLQSLTVETEDDVEKMIYVEALETSARLEQVFLNLIYAYETNFNQ